MPGNKTKIQTRAADHGFGEQPHSNTSLTGQAEVALPEARAAKRSNSRSERRENVVQGLTRAERGVSLGVVRLIVTADIYWFSLNREQLFDDRVFGRAEFGRDWREKRLQFLIFALLRQGLRPVQRQIKVTAAIVDAADFARGRLVIFEELAVRRVERIGQHFRLRVLEHDAQMLERCCEREEFAQRIPA